jgi:hypothetical protein
VRVGEFEQPPGFFKTLPRLNGDAAVVARRFEQRSEVFREEVALERGHVRGHPCVLGGAVMPEVLVGVDSHVFGWLFSRRSLSSL